jgi:hypothetical protein
LPLAGPEFDRTSRRNRLQQVLIFTMLRGAPAAGIIASRRSLLPFVIRFP